MRSRVALVRSVVWLLAETLRRGKECGTEPGRCGLRGGFAAVVVGVGVVVARLFDKQKPVLIRNMRAPI